MALLPDGNVVVSGVTQPGGERLPDNDAETVAYDPQGTIVWQARWSDTAASHEFVFDLDVDASGRIALTGTTQDNTSPYVPPFRSRCAMTPAARCSRRSAATAARRSTSTPPATSSWRARCDVAVDGRQVQRERRARLVGAAERRRRRRAVVAVRRGRLGGRRHRRGHGERHEHGLGRLPDDPVRARRPRAVAPPLRRGGRPGPAGPGRGRRDRRRRGRAGHRHLVERLPVDRRDRDGHRHAQVRAGAAPALTAPASSTPPRCRAARSGCAGRTTRAPRTASASNGAREPAAPRSRRSRSSVTT